MGCTSCRPYVECSVFIPAQYHVSVYILRRRSNTLHFPGKLHLIELTAVTKMAMLGGSLLRYFVESLHRLGIYSRERKECM